MNEMPTSRSSGVVNAAPPMRLSRAATLDQHTCSADGSVEPGNLMITSFIVHEVGT